jgi:hypothetical protein
VDAKEIVNTDRIRRSISPETFNKTGGGLLSERSENVIGLRGSRTYGAFHGWVTVRGCCDSTTGTTTCGTSSMRSTPRILRLPFPTASPYDSTAAAHIDRARRLVERLV